MAAPKDYYKILGISENADAATIKRAYRELARKYHPDVGGKAHEERFKEINEAYQVLSDPKKRAEYDRLRHGFAEREARRRGPGYQRVSFDLNDLGFGGDWTSWLEDWLGGTRWGPDGRTARRPEPPEETLSVTLEQVALGGRVVITVQEVEPCPVCRGTNPDCARCQGLGQVTVPKKFEVTIPPGVEDGTILRVGDHARLKVEVAPHPRFTRQGADLKGRLMVSVPLAAVGGEVTVKPLVGEPVAVTIPRHTNAGTVLRLKGLGLPRRGGGPRGDLLLEVQLRFPEPFTAADDRLYEELLRNHHDERGGEIHAPR
ncbi:MAG: J domain-containing protein [Firmicutes bacterium]|nr:J domain-containing protein [Alicyclobacillaceae bacterium]MCL6496405.1 J domain-containing protein [Bacillota bacterium]